MRDDPVAFEKVGNVEHLQLGKGEGQVLHRGLIHVDTAILDRGDAIRSEPAPLILSMDFDHDPAGRQRLDRLRQRVGIRLRLRESFDMRHHLNGGRRPLLARRMRVAAAGSQGSQAAEQLSSHSRGRSGRLSG